MHNMRTDFRLIPLVMAFGLAAIWTAHIGADRMLGYGLKLGSSFDQTHLGPIGKARRKGALKP